MSKEIHTRQCCVTFFYNFRLSFSHCHSLIRRWQLYTARQSVVSNHSGDQQVSAAAHRTAGGSGMWAVVRRSLRGHMPVITRFLIYESSRRRRRRRRAVHIARVYIHSGVISVDGNGNVRCAWFPALRFRLSVQIGSSSIFSRPRCYQVCGYAHLEARVTRGPAHWASRAIDNSTRPFAVGYAAPKRQRHYGNDATERHYGDGFTETDTDERKRNAGNQTLRCPHIEIKLKQNSFKTVLKLFQNCFETVCFSQSKTPRPSQLVTACAFNLLVYCNQD